MAKKKEKDPFEDLPTGYVESVESMTTEDIRKELAQVVMLHIDTKERYKNDPDVEQAKDALEQVAGPYKDDLKGLSLKTQYIKLALESRGAGLK